VNCNGDSVRLGTTNLIDVDYLWTPNIELDNANTALPWSKTTTKRQYYLTAKNKITGCISKDSVTIDIINSQLTGTKTTKNLNCFNDSSGELRIIATKGYIPYSYATSTNPYQSSNLITNLKATKNSNYFIRDAKGCIFRDTFSLSEPDSIRIQNIKAKDLLCANDSSGEIEVAIFGGTSPYRFQWDRNLPNLLFLNKLDGGSYTIQVTDTNNCTKSKTISLFEPNQLELDKVIIIQNPCFQDSIGSIAVTAKGGTHPYKYQWSTGSIEHKITKLRAGTYKLTLSDKNNCNFTYKDSLVDPPLLWIDTIYRTDLNCEENATINILAKGGTPFYTYSIDSGINFSRLSKDYVFKIGKYHVAVKDKNQCLSRDTVSIKGVEHIKIDVSPEDTIIRMNEWVQLKYRVTKGDSNAIQSLRWTPSTGLSCTDCSNPIVHGYVSEIYTLEVRYNVNCLTKDKVSIRYKEENYYIPNAFTPASENPENNQVKIYSNNVLRSRLVIFNRWGEKVFEGIDAHRIGWNGIYNGIPAPMAVYVYYAEIIHLNGRKIFTSGDVTLIR
jgi:gliding motility-associated-like protein